MFKVKARVIHGNRASLSYRIIFNHLALIAVIMINSSCFAQFNLDATTLAFSKQQYMCAKADSLFRKGKFKLACTVYNDIFATTPNNRKYAIRQIRCKLQDEPATPEMIHFLASRGIGMQAIRGDSILWPYLSALLANLDYPGIEEDKYMDMLDSVAEVDQSIRRPDVPLEKALRVDSSNYRLLMDCLMARGAFINSYGSILVLIHQLSEHPHDMPYIIGLLNSALLENNIDPETYANILDRTFYSMYKCVPFGVLKSENGDLDPCISTKLSWLYRTRLGLMW